MDTPGTSWEFFVSYATADQEWAEWVAWQIEKAGFRVLLQAWDFVPGTHWTTRMEDGITRSGHTLAILSRAYLKSVYGRAEWEAAYRVDPQGLRRKLIPIRIEPCARPGLLGGIVSVDLFNCAADAASNRLLEAITAAKTGRAKPGAAPGFPGAPPPTLTLTPPRRPPRIRPPRFPRGTLPIGGGLFATFAVGKLVHAWRESRREAERRIARQAKRDKLIAILTVFAFVAIVLIFMFVFA